MNRSIFCLIFLLSILTSCTEKNYLIGKIEQLDKSMQNQTKSVSLYQLPIVGTYALLYPKDQDMTLKYAGYLIKAGYPRESRPFLEPWCKLNSQARELYLTSILINGCIDSIPELIIPKEQLELSPDYTYYLEVNHAYSTIRAIDSQLVKNPFETALYEKRGILFAGVKDTSEALWDFNKALALDSTLHSVYYNRSLLYYTCDQFTKAKNELLRYFEKTNDTQKEVYKQIITSLSDLEQQYSQQPKNPNYLNKRSRIFAKIGEYKRALTDMNYLIQTEAANADYYAFRAYLHYFLKNKEAALLDISEAERLSGKTNSPLAKKIREMN